MPEIDAEHQIEANGHVARNALLLAAVAAGIGLAFSRSGTSAALVRGACDIGRSLRQGFDGAGGLIGRMQKRAQPHRVVPRKIATDEPMAGYGA